jgi:hypothetical protein
VHALLAGEAAANRIKSATRQIPADLAIIGDIARPLEPLKE